MTTDEEIYYKHTSGGGQETRDKVNILKMMENARKEERKKNENDLKDAKNCILNTNAVYFIGKLLTCSRKRLCNNESCPFNRGL